MHRLVVEHDVGVVVLRADLPQPSEVGVRVRVSVHRLPGRAPVEPEVGESVRCRLLVERVDRVDEPEVFTYSLDAVGRPGTAHLYRLQRLGPDRLEGAVDRW